MREITDADIDALLDIVNRNKGAADNLSCDEARRAAIRGYDNVQACPGSGKTTLLGLKLMILASRLDQPHCGVCVLSHTNVAKEEISKRIGKSETYAHLLRYPNFVGTIQEFVDRFIALPYARSQGWNLRIVDDEIFDGIAERAMRGLVRTQAPRLSNGHQDQVSYYFNRGNVSYSDLRFVAGDAGLKVKSKILDGLGRFVNLDGTGFDLDLLTRKRIEIAKWGYVTYGEMYEIARQSMKEIPSLTDALRDRFKIVLCDEMQDTQRHQEELLVELFRYEGSRFQCLGDPDQAIFDGMGDALPNQSYNQGVVAPISLSHRFTSPIATAMSGLSIRKLGPIQTSVPLVAHNEPVTLIVYRDGEEAHVLDSFGYLVSRLPVEDRKIVKGLGAVAKESGDRVSIKTYFPAFSRAKAAKPRVRTLYEAVTLCDRQTNGHVHELYSHLTNCCLTLLHLADRRIQDRIGRDTSLNAITLKPYLIGRKTYRAYRNVLVRLLLGPPVTEAQWAEITDRLLRALELERTDANTAYLAYGSVAPAVASPESASNIFRSKDGVNIEVATIHSVKGETHDATLVMETMFRRRSDLQDMLPYLIDHTLAAPVFDATRPATVASLKANFMKRLYVAGTRPRNLLAFAINQSRITDPQCNALADLGWRIVHVVPVLEPEQNNGAVG